MLQKSYHTKTSDLIAEFLQKSMDHGFTAAELSDFLKQNGVAVNKTTVYRNLDKMTESGQLVKRKSMTADGFVYQASEEEKHCEEHIHFLCSKCGSVIHLSDKKTERYLKSLSDDLGLQINLSQSSLNGICPKCKKSKGGI